MAKVLNACFRGSSNSVQLPVAALAPSVITRWLHFVSTQWLHGGGPDFENGGRQVAGTRIVSQFGHDLSPPDRILHFRGWLSG